jgi:hypothetical protein
MLPPSLLPAGTGVDADADDHADARMDTDHRVEADNVAESQAHTESDAHVDEDHRADSRVPFGKIHAHVDVNVNDNDNHDDNHKDWRPVVSVAESELVYDYRWFPRMSSADPVSCVFVSSARDHPIHMWDAASGTLRATYRAYDHLDEVCGERQCDVVSLMFEVGVQITAAFSLAFTPCGSQLLGGYERCVRIFDVARPGRECTALPTGTKHSGLTGMIRCGMAAHAFVEWASA